MTDLQKSQKLLEQAIQCAEYFHQLSYLTPLGQADMEKETESKYLSLGMIESTYEQGRNKDLKSVQEMKIEIHSKITSQIA